MSEFLNLHELVDAARRQLGANDWDFICGGAETETTLRRNRHALDTTAFRPRVLNDVLSVDLTTRCFERTLRLPLTLAPIGRYTFGGGPIAITRAAGRFGCAAMLSSVNSEATLESVAAAVPEALRIYQLYVRGDAGWIDAQVDRAQDHGYGAFCVTVDTAVISRRERDIANRYLRGSPRDTPELAFQAGFDWRSVERLRRRCTLPLILKGVNTAEDAELAVAHGFDMVCVSNHGGRQIDHSLGSFALLPEIVQAVGGRAKVMVDGGFYRGSDVIKGLAAGADLVGLGRLHCWALAAGGEEGVIRMFELLEHEMRLCMQLLGVARLADLSPTMLRAAPLVSRSDLSAPFPLLGAAGPMR